MARSELAYWLALHSTPGLGPVTMRRLLDHFGEAAAAAEAGEDELLSVGPISLETMEGLRAIGERLTAAESQLAEMRKRGARVVRYVDREYPAALNGLANPPPLIFMLGELAPADERSVGIVGATSPSPRGRPLATGFAARLAREGCAIVSGYAHGIDSAAHRGALAAGGRTVMVAPTGILGFQPRWGYPPLGELAKRGAVISEAPPDAPWKSLAAVMRNRLIAALSRALIVIETSPAGGALHTVRAAQRLERPVFAVRYARTPAAARGNELVLGLGGKPLTRFAEVDEVLKAV